MDLKKSFIELINEYIVGASVGEGAKNYVMDVFNVAVGEIFEANAFTTVLREKTKEAGTGDNEISVSDMIFNNELVIYKIAGYLCKTKDILALKAVNHTTHRIVPCVPSTKNKKNVLKWKINNDNDREKYDEYETRFMCRSLEKLRTLNLPFVPFIGKKRCLSIYLNKHDSKDHISALINGLYSAIKNPHNLQGIVIRRWWDNHDHHELWPLFNSLELDGISMDMNGVMSSFKKLNVDLKHEWGHGGYRGDKSHLYLCVFNSF
jgi:hypothetical protein